MVIARDENVCIYSRRNYLPRTNVALFLLLLSQSMDVPTTHGFQHPIVSIDRTTSKSYKGSGVASRARPIVFDKRISLQKKETILQMLSTPPRFSSSSTKGESRVTVLLLKPLRLFKDGNNSNNNNNDNNSGTNDDGSNKRSNNRSWFNVASEKQRQFMESMEERRTVVVESFFQLLPPQASAFIKFLLQKISEFLPTFRTISLSFMAGAVVSICVVIAPLFTMADKFTEPVTLFETILTDLDRGYVDTVDTQKLFETGVTAMLRSLDPYTEFEGKSEAVAMQESVAGKYAGVGLVISGPNSRQGELLNMLDDDDDAGVITSGEMEDAAAADSPPSTLLNFINNNYKGTDMKKQQINLIKDQQIKDTITENAAATRDNRKINVVAAFEGYAFDAGMRVGDRIVAVDDFLVNRDTTVDEVRSRLRGIPGTTVAVSFEREGVLGVQTVNIPRQIVKIHDVKAATLLSTGGNNNVGYIELRGFSEDAGREMRAAITSIQRRSQLTTGSELNGLILDLRQNPGGLLTQAVDVASLFVPKGSDIVSARGRGFPNVLYRSRVEPLVDPTKTNVVVLVSGSTASAAEIVSGAIQDLDVGVILGSDRTYGKGLVQSVESLPFDTALKFTVAKYYTPSGRCIQSTQYLEGGGLNAQESKFTAKKVKEEEKSDFYTKGGRVVKDGGGIEVDIKVKAPKASALEVALLRSNLLNEFAAEWSKSHGLTNNHDNFGITGDTYNEFQKFVLKKQENKEVDLLSQIYGSPLDDLRKALKKSGYNRSLKNELANLQASILNEMKNDFVKYRSDIKEDLEQSILARYLPESMLIERAIKSDKQVKAAADLLADKSKYDTVLARINTGDNPGLDRATELASGGRPGTGSYGILPSESEKEVGVRLNFKF